MRTSCDKCEAVWTAHKYEHCTGCCETFSSTGAGDMHRVGKHHIWKGPERRRCRTQYEMLERGLVPRAKANGLIVWGRGGQNPSRTASPLESEGLTALREGSYTTEVLEASLRREAALAAIVPAGGYSAADF